MSDQKFVYIVNLTDTKISLRQGMLTINPRGYAKRVEGFEKEESVEYAAARNWIKIQTTEPTQHADGIPPAVMRYFDPNQGLSLNEVRDLLLKDKGKTVGDAIDFAKVPSETHTVKDEGVPVTPNLPNPELETVPLAHATPEEMETRSLADPANPTDAELAKADETSEVSEADVKKAAHHRKAKEKAGE